MRRRAAAGLGAALVLALYGACRPRAEGLPDERPDGGRYVVDAAGLVADESETRMNELLGAMLDDLDIELVAVSVAGLGGEPIADFANRLVDRWEVGDRTRAGRGLLLVVAEAEEEVRFEVGYGLEGLFTDAFVGYVERDQMAPWFESGEVGHGIEATVELIAGRAYERLVGRGYDPARRGPATIGGFRSGGAGAETEVALGGGGPPATRTAGPDVRARFAAQPTPELAWERFLELNRRRIKDPELGIYDAGSRERMRGVVTDAGQDHIARLYGDARPTFRIRGDRAAVVFLDDPNHLLAPWFFRRTADGWQLDGGILPGLVRYNHKNQWRFTRLDHPYRFAFEDFRFDEHGFGRPPD